MIVATAGHVDHGKALLVKALSGVDTDRLPEEKRRGLTIDLGFAYLPVGPGKTIGFIDVPGHEHFIRNMLCGVSGIDFVLLVIAADDGPMPQTREHLAILDLLGVSGGAIVLTKLDRVPPERIAEISAEVSALITGTTLAGMPVFPVSALTGMGIGELKGHLERIALDFQPRDTSGNFRLAVDLAEDRILHDLGLRLPREAVIAIAAEFAHEGAKGSAGVHLPSRTPKLSPADAVLWQKIAPLLDRNSLRPPLLPEIAQAIGAEMKKTELTLQRASGCGLVYRVSQNRFFLPSILRQLGELAQDLARQSGNGRVTTAAFRDRSGVGRRLSVEVLEFFDRVKFTRRVGDEREVLRPVAEAFIDKQTSAEI